MTERMIFKFLYVHARRKVCTRDHVTFLYLKACRWKITKTLLARMENLQMTSRKAPMKKRVPKKATVTKWRRSTTIWQVRHETPPRFTTPVIPDISACWFVVFIFSVKHAVARTLFDSTGFLEIKGCPAIYWMILFLVRLCCFFLVAISAVMRQTTKFSFRMVLVIALFFIIVCLLLFIAFSRPKYIL